MLVAIRQQLAGWDRKIELAVDGSFGSYRDKARHGLLQKYRVSKPGRAQLSLALMPQSLRRSAGLVREREIDAVLDASGFAFGDQLPLQRSERFAQDCERWARQGKPVILLPQALGPFENAPHRAAFKRIAASATIVFARDEQSLSWARDVVGSDADVLLAPDITILVRPELSPTPESRRCSRPA